MKVISCVKIIQLTTKSRPICNNLNTHTIELTHIHLNDFRWFFYMKTPHIVLKGLQGHFQENSYLIKFCIDISKLNEYTHILFTKNSVAIRPIWFILGQLIMCSFPITRTRFPSLNSCATAFDN